MEKIENLEENVVNKEPATLEKTKKKEKKPKKRLHHYDEEHDIRYRGPLSYRHLRIIAWTFFALSQVGVLFSLLMFFDNTTIDMLSVPTNILSCLPSLMMPLFMMASFSIILNAKDGYKRLFVAYGGFSLLILAAFVLVYEHYALGIVGHFAGGREKGKEIVDLIINNLIKGGYLSFNIFIDLLLFTFFAFCVLYNPKKFFKGKKIIIFRLLSILPIIYEITSLVLKALNSSGVISLDAYFLPFLTTKPPLMFLGFIIMVLFVKFREKRFVKFGGNKKDYPKFLQTNANSFHFGLFSTIVFIAVALLDVIIAIIGGAVIASINSFNSEEGVAVISAIQTMTAMGFGKTLPVIFIAPLFVLFSYTKTHKNKMIDIIIPIAGIAITVFILLEGFYWLIVSM